MAYSTYSRCLTMLVLTTMLSSFQFSQAATPTYLLPIMKDTSKPQYYTSFLLGTPAFRVYLSIDLSSPWSWFACNTVGFNITSYSPIPNSSTYRVLRCTNTTSCAAYDSYTCYDCSFSGCILKGKACMGEIYPPYFYTHDSFQGHSLLPLLKDLITIYKSNSLTPVKTRLFGFPFGCAGIDDLKGLSHYTKGVLSLARKDLSLPNLIAKTFKVPRKFALCLPSSYSRGVNGAILFGGGPYVLPPSKLKQSLTFATTPLVVNPVDIGITYEKRNSSAEYFFNVKSIQVEGKPLAFNSSLLTIDKNGIGGTKINLIYPYTTLHTNIYNALVEAFTSKAAVINITRVAPVSSFGACFSSRNIVGTTTGPKVPNIDIVLDGKNSIWRIYGANSMIKVSKDVRCLAFVDGAVAVKTSIVLGGKQMEDSLIEFDLESSKLGVASLLRFGTSCSQFQAM